MYLCARNFEAEAIFEAVCAVLRLLPQQPSPSSHQYGDHKTYHNYSHGDDDTDDGHVGGDDVDGNDGGDDR